MQWGQIDTPSGASTIIRFPSVFNSIYSVQAINHKHSSTITTGILFPNNSNFTWLQNVACMWIAIGT